MYTVHYSQLLNSNWLQDQALKFEITFPKSVVNKINITNLIVSPIYNQNSEGHICNSAILNEISILHVMPQNE